MERREERWRRKGARFDYVGGRRYDDEHQTARKMGAAVEDAVGMKRVRSKLARLCRREKGRGEHLMRALRV